MNAESNPTPNIVKDEDGVFWEFSHIEDRKLREELVKWAKKMKAGRPFFEDGKEGNYSFQNLYNVNVAECYNCKDISIWIFDRLVYPQRGEAPQANPDLPEDVRRDYDEASTILDHSPRGAAALIRLGIQKLCKELGQPGENINADIKALVAGGLDPRVQKALDAVRVIGNNAVHPGQIDLRDDRATAESLFRLMNLIAEKLISEPKHVDEVYASLPAGALDAIEKRDGKTK
ncbi:DUF4145 domain-containing protein [Hoeflea sp.]|uniref:DUF4145 domain-containing protein n=1 Tax=Hoeflea sp. TaxID=1940281 RepID=UPI0025BDFCE7|nr:DUF4145 domain-containing protein [Hoeflea sp.]